MCYTTAFYPINHFNEHGDEPYHKIKKKNITELKIIVKQVYKIKLQIKYLDQYL